MVRIILCDDDKFILELARERILQETDRYGLAAEIACIATDSLTVFRYMDQNPGEYLCFLDLDFGKGNLNGIDIARQIKEKSRNSKIVFVTNHHEMALQVLKSGVEPFGFIEKTADMENLSRGYRKYIKMAENAMVIQKQEEAEEDTIILQVGLHDALPVNRQQIIYVEAEKNLSHCISYHTVDGSVITVRDSIENSLEKLGAGFIKSHRSVIVNKRHIIGLSEGGVKMSNGEEAACSFRMKGEIKRCLA